jgi:hypothetical protein
MLLPSMLVALRVMEPGSTFSGEHVGGAAAQVHPVAALAVLHGLEHLLEAPLSQGLGQQPLAGLPPGRGAYFGQGRYRVATAPLEGDVRELGGDGKDVGRGTLIQGFGSGFHGDSFKERERSGTTTGVA